MTVTIFPSFSSTRQTFMSSSTDQKMKSTSLASNKTRLMNYTKRWKNPNHIPQASKRSELMISSKFNCTINCAPKCGTSLTKGGSGFWNRWQWTLSTQERQGNLNLWVIIHEWAHISHQPLHSVGQPSRRQAVLQNTKESLLASISSRPLRNIVEFLPLRTNPVEVQEECQQS